MWRRRSAVPAAQLIEVVTPRTNAARMASAEHLIASLMVSAAGARVSPLSLELSAECGQRRFLVRATSPHEQRRVAAQLGAAYPQAALRHFTSESFPGGDPAHVGPDEQAATVTLELRAGAHLPLRTREDRELNASMASEQADPLLSVLGTMVNLPVGWRMLAQVILVEPAPADWARPYQQLAAERARDQESQHEPGTSFLRPLVLLGLVGAYFVWTAAQDAIARAEWLTLVAWAVVGSLLIAAMFFVARWLGRREVLDPRLVQAKLGFAACKAEIRLTVFAPEHADTDSVTRRLEEFVAAYRSFSLPAGNSLVPGRLQTSATGLQILEPLARVNLLNVRELAGLWHLVHADDDVPLLERTTARRRLPLPAAVARGSGGSVCEIGTSQHQGLTVPVYLHDALLGRHLLAVAKTRRGKSTLLLRIAQHVMRAGGRRLSARVEDAAHRALILVDPHRDLATATLGLVPRDREDAVVYLDVSNRRRPFGLNLLDVGLGWDRDQATSNALRIFHREFDGFWGPRMEDAFRFALMALFEANQAVCWADQRWGRGSQHTILEVPPLLALRGFRRRVLKQVNDPSIKQWFDDYFDALEPRLRQEIINPVQTKVHRYLGSLVARQIVGQPRSTVDFRQLVADGKIVIINLNAFDVGEDVAALIGGTLLNLAARAVSAQATLASERRHPVTLIVDEFHTIPGADYEQICGELAKYGANLVLATQTVARLERLALGQQQTRDLRSVVFSNLDGLFAFHTSAEDARYLADELGGGLDEQDLLELGHFQCYARLTDMRTGERLPAFSVTLAPPTTADSSRAARLAMVSAERFGRDALEVELDRQAAIARIDGGRRRPSDQPMLDADEQASWPLATPNAGIPAPDGVVAGGHLPQTPVRTAGARGRRRLKLVTPTKPPAAGDESGTVAGEPPDADTTPDL